MADDTKTDPPKDDTKTDPPKSDPPKPDPKDGSDGDDVDTWKGHARKHEKEAKRLADRVKELEDKEKTESERLTEAKAAAEKDAADAKAELRRTRIALKKGLPAELADRLRGDDDEEMEADADRLLKLVKPGADGAGSFEGGTRGGAASAPGSMNEMFKQAYEAKR